jgi:hypothetical protein
MSNRQGPLTRPGLRSEWRPHGYHPRQAEGLDGELLVDLLEALDARPELLGPAMSADVRRHSIGVTVTLEVADEAEAQKLAGVARGEALVAPGMADAWMPAGAALR